MGMNSYLKNFNGAARAIALILSCGLLSAPGQAPMQAASSGLNALGQALSSAAGLSEIAKGNMNTQQGESTQNMAQMAMGAMQIASGLLGLLAAAAAGDKANTAGSRQSGLSSSPYNPTNYGTSVTPPSTNPKGSTTGESASSNLGDGTTSGTSSIDFNSKPIATALASIEKNYGIPGDKFMEALKNGVAPKDIFANAPKNAISADLGNRIAEGLAAGSTSGSDAANSIANLANVGGAGTGSPTGTPVPETGSSARAPASASADLEDLDTAPNMNLSPEIRAAMAAKAEKIRREKEMKEMHGWTIFQLVANRYRKLEPMLYGRVERTNPNPVPPQVRN